MPSEYSLSPINAFRYLGATCNDGFFDVVALTGGGATYRAPSSISANPCLCNTVYYSVIMACSWCQYSDIVSWSNWIINCPASYSTKSFPYAVPLGTVVPPWADIDPTVGGWWSDVEAQQYASEWTTQFLIGNELTVSYSQSRRLPR